MVGDKKNKMIMTSRPSDAMNYTVVVVASRCLVVGDTIAELVFHLLLNF